MRVLELNEETAVRYAELRLELKKSGSPLPANDVWVAALCQAVRPTDLKSRPAL